MATDANQNDNNEYNYAEEQRIDAYPLRSPSTIAVLFSKLKQQRALLVAIGVVLVIYVVFKIVNIAERNKPTDIETKPVVKPPVVTTTNNIPQPQIQPLQVQQPVVSTVDNSNSAFPQIQSSLADIDQKMYNVQQSLNSLDNTLRQLNFMMQQQLMMQQRREQQQLGALRNRVGNVYHVQAIIPNRAWLAGPRGSTLTVEIGSIIPGVGKVTVINPEEGNVVTDTGVTIHYSLEDL